MEAKQLVGVPVLELINDDLKAISNDEMFRVFKNCATKCFYNFNANKLTYDEGKCVEKCLYSHFEDRDIDKI
jgi:hypothetical protein